MRLYTYAEFFKAYVLRKKQDIMAPRNHPVSDIILPRGSLIHYMPKHEQDEGPSVKETFISNYPGETYIDFQFGFTPILGKGHPVTFNSTPVIKFYRNKHYNYKWMRDLSAVYNKDSRLVVQNHALAQRGWKYSPNKYINFFKAYNDWNMLFSCVNETGHNHPMRNQFIRIDLPLNMPGWKLLTADITRYEKSFVEGLPVPDNSFLHATKAENCYWLMDLWMYLSGNTEQSLFGKLDPNVLDKVHLMFVTGSRTIIINLGMLMSWYKPLQDTEAKITVAVKRFYLLLINFVNNTQHVNTPEITDDQEQDNRGLAGGTEKTEDSAGGEGQVQIPPDEVETGEDVNGPDDTSPRSITDLFSKPKEIPRTDTGTGSGKGSSFVSPSDGTQGATEPTDTSTGGREPSEDTLGDEDALNWLSPIDDALLEPMLVSEAIATQRDIFDTPESGIKLALRELAKEGSLTVKQQQYYEKKAESYKTIGMPNGQSLEDFIKITPEELKDIGGDIRGDFTTILDETLLRQRVVSLRNDYPKKFMHKDIAAAVLNIQNTGIILADYQIDQVEDIEGSYQVIKVQLMPVNGKAAVRVFRFPTVDDNGMFLVDGVKSYFQFQRIEKPIRKIAEDRVVLTSYYDKKVNITRSEFVADNYGNELIKRIQLLARQKKLFISIGNLVDRSVISPRYVTMLSRKFKTIVVPYKESTLDFDFDTHGLIEQHPEWKNLNKPDNWVVGTYRGKAMCVDEYGNISVGTETLGAFEDLLGIDMAKMPVEYSVINIGGYRFPAGVVLCYYFGIDELLKVLKARYRTIPSGQRYKLDKDEYSLDFNDERLIFNKRDRLTALVFGGMTKLNNMINFSRADLNKRGIWVPLMGDPKVRPNHFNEMKNMFDLFIDPITKERLKGMGYSTTFHYLLIDAVKMLVNDHTRHEVEIEEQLVIGYERFVSHIYSELCKSNRQFQSKPKTGNQTFDLNPEAVITNIITDSSKGDVKEMSPFHALKSQEDVTFGGFKGRDEQTMLKRTRGQLKSYKGVISEANKDSGKVGFSAFLTSDPRIEDFRGGIDTKEQSKGAQLLSSIGSLRYGGLLDDPKRSSFSSIQSSHAISAKNYTPNIIRTGGDVTAAHRLDDIYSKVAKKAGTVTAITKDGITVTYEDGTTDSCQLGLRLGKADGDLYRHTLVTSLSAGDKFPVGRVLAYDEEWFAPDIYNPGQVSLKTGRMTRALFIEDQTVYED